jgi:hypothetical protein
MKTSDLTQSETLGYIDAGIEIHKSDSTLQAGPFEAKHYFSAGYAQDLFNSGSGYIDAFKDEAAISFIGSLKTRILQFVSAALDAENFGESITVNGAIFTVTAEGFGFAIRRADGKLIAATEFPGRECPLKVFLGDDFVVYGQTVLRHALVGERQEQAFLIGNFYPMSLIVAAIGLASRP